MPSYLILESKMSLKASASLAAFCILASISPQANAQTSAVSKYSSVAKESRVEKVPSERRGPTSIAEQQREAAVSIIIRVADESNKFKDQALRVRVQARAADALWDSDHDLARALFL